MGSRLCLVAAEGWHYTVSYNKWTGPLERAAQALPATAWTQNGDTSHAFLRHQPEGRNAPQLFAVSRRRDGAREVAARLTRQFRQILRWFGETPLVFLCLTHAVVAARGVFPRPPGHAALVVVGVRPFRLPPRLPRPVFGAVCQEVIA